MQIIVNDKTDRIIFQDLTWEEVFNIQMALLLAEGQVEVEQPKKILNSLMDSIALASKVTFGEVVSDDSGT